MIDKRPGTIAKMFDRIAPTYDRVNAILSLSMDRFWRYDAIRRLDLQDNDLALDIATGTGDLALCALKDARCTVCALDLSNKMLRIARSKAGDCLIQDNYIFTSGDALAMPFRGESFDKAMVAFGIRNMTDLDRFFVEVHRVLKEEGRLVVLELGMPQRLFFRQIYLIYFTRLLPLIGGIISGDMSAYRYLRDSVMSFLSPQVLKRTMQQNGFVVVYSRSLFFGICHLYLLEKKHNEDIL